MATITPPIPIDEINGRPQVLPLLQFLYGHCSDDGIRESKAKLMAYEDVGEESLGEQYIRGAGEAITYCIDEKLIERFRRGWYPWLRLTVRGSRQVEDMKKLKQGSGCLEESDEHKSESTTLQLFIDGNTDTESNKAVFGGNRYPLTDAQARIIKRLINADGAYVPKEKLKKYPGSEENISKIKRTIPRYIRELIGTRTGRGGGYRLTVRGEIMGQ